jgi:uncharacterized membrane protein YoaK (UPF0700 family)
MLSNVRQTDTSASFGLAFFGGFGDAASFVLAKTFTGHVTGNLVLTAIVVAADMAHGVEIFVIFVSLALGLQNGAFRRAGGISVHTTHLTGMLTSLISTETERYASETVPPTVRAPDPKIGLVFSAESGFIYLLFFPFHLWGLATLIGVGSVAVSLLRRPDDIITTGITTAVVMVVAAISPDHAWKQPILRVVDTIVGVAVGVAGAWISLRSGHHRSTAA